MAYRVDYGGYVNYPAPPRKGRGRTCFLTAAFLFLFLAGVNHFWPEGAMVLDRLLSAERFLETGRTLDALAQELRGGEQLWDVLTAFCQDIVRMGLDYAA